MLSGLLWKDDLQPLRQRADFRWFVVGLFLP
jgi:hypothetical protein